MQPLFLLNRVLSASNDFTCVDQFRATKIQSAITKFNKEFFRNFTISDQRIALAENKLLILGLELVARLLSSL